MRTWHRSPGDQKCGKCRALIGRGDPILHIVIAGSAFVRIRCKACADEPVPADLATLAERQVAVTPTLKPRRQNMGVLPLDFKTAACGREPGCDDV